MFNLFVAVSVLICLSLYPNMDNKNTVSTYFGRAATINLQL